ncbi:hypothetical protein [Paenibacillus sp. Leaf72]|uniref:hypothetical protein n=1 Tax=Paenibacillus sp. Leaf72 TaxID=1736234 RepID=UPI0006F2F7FC|nr:hypothetical protein [Paenibacillus sp. Leaf72]KQN96147.1 hypothetical protein ASF12_25340 [Paenibacillus sp. Leaf72]
MSKKMKPPYLGPKGTGKVISKVTGTKRLQSGGPTFNRLTVVWVTTSGVPFNTTGFFARLFRGNTVVAIAAFDRFGVVRFNQIETLTNVSYTIRLFNSNGVLFRTAFIPAGVQTFAVIG